MESSPLDPPPPPPRQPQQSPCHNDSNASSIPRATTSPTSSSSSRMVVQEQQQQHQQQQQQQPGGCDNDKAPDTAASVVLPPETCRTIRIVSIGVSGSSSSDDDDAPLNNNAVVTGNKGILQHPSAGDDDDDDDKNKLSPGKIVTWKAHEEEEEEKEAQDSRNTDDAKHSSAAPVVESSSSSSSPSPLSLFADAAAAVADGDTRGLLRMQTPATSSSSSASGSGGGQLTAAVGENTSIGVKMGTINEPWTKNNNNNIQTTTMETATTTTTSREGSPALSSPAVHQQQLMQKQKEEQPESPGVNHEDEHAIIGAVATMVPVVVLAGAEPKRPPDSSSRMPACVSTATAKATGETMCIAETAQEQQQQQQPAEMDSPAGAKQQQQQQQQQPQQPPPPQQPCKKPRILAATANTLSVRNGPREELSFADARPCVEHYPTLQELQSQSFSDYVRHTVLRAALPRYRPDSDNDNIDGNNDNSISTCAPASRATKKKKTTQSTTDQGNQAEAKSNNTTGGGDDDREEKVVIVEPDWTIQTMPLTQGMAKVTLPHGFWEQEGIGHDTTGRGPAWQAGTELGDLCIHSPIQQHVRGMAGIYEYTFMDHTTSNMTVAEFRQLADDYQEEQIPMSLSLRKKKKKTPTQPKTKTVKKSPTATSTATTSAASTTATVTPLPGADTEMEKVNNPTVDGGVASCPKEAAQKNSIDSSTEVMSPKAVSVVPEMETVEPTDSKNGVANGDVNHATAADEDKNTGSDEDADPAIHEYSNERIHKLEEKFWKRLGPTMSPAIYGADQEGTLFGDDPASGWSLADLDSCLHVLPKDVPGVTSPYLYVGMWASVFCAHAEDMNLLSINYLHAGAPKIWYAIAPGSDAQRFESLCEFHFLHGSSASAARPTPRMMMSRMTGPSPSSSRKRKKQGDSSGATLATTGGGKAGKPQYCKEFLRHKRSLLSPKILQRAGIRYTTTIQRPGDAIITFPSGYHFGFNIGFNVAEATNFAIPEWIPYGLQAKVCLCRPDSVRIDMARLIQLLQLYQKDLAERTALVKRQYKSNASDGFLSWKEWRQLREYEKEKRQSKKKKQQRLPISSGGGFGSIKGARMNLTPTCRPVSDEQKSDQQRRNEFWVEVVKPVAKNYRPQVQLMSLADQLRNNAAAAAAKEVEKEEEPIILEGKRKRKKSAKAAALEQEEQERLLEKQQREQQQTSPVVESTQTNVQPSAPTTNEIWHLAKPIIIPATGARSQQRRRIEVSTRVLCLLPGTVMASDDHDHDVNDDEEEDEQCFAGQVVEISDDHVLVHMDGLPRSEDIWLPMNSPKLFLDGGRWKDDNMIEADTGTKKKSSTTTGLPKLHYWQEIDSKELCLSEDEEND